LTFKGYSYSPGLTIIKEINSINGCQYLVDYSFCIDDDNLLDTGLFYLRQEVFYLSLTDDDDDASIIFDLTIADEDTYAYDAVFRKNNNQVSYDISFIEKVLIKNRFVFIFKIHDSFCEKSSFYDQVFFIKEKSGVIGSYISRMDKNEVEWVYSPRGNILLEELDYSKKKFGKIL
jgi:hypothetical protein